MKKRSTKILVVEDDPNLSEVLSDSLEMVGYEVILAIDGENGIKAFRKTSPHMILLDIMLPQKDGFAVAKEIRKLDDQVPIIFLTAKTMEADRISGFKIGCDDYITKPFSFEELNLRIKAILKRSAAKPIWNKLPQKKIYKMGNMSFDPNNLILKSPSGKRTLTKKESALLQLLADNMNQLVTRDFALKVIWGDDDYYIGRSMDVFITKLRKYLREGERVQIKNIHGVGFKLETTN
jgi:DNA-binding response OmpR family regulator